MSLLSVERLTVVHPRRSEPALREVTLSVEAGDVLGIIGESGSGKSTLLKAWLGLIPLRSGLVRWGADELTSLRGPELARRRRDVQPVFQDTSLALDPLQSIERCLAEPFEVHRVPFTRSTLEALLTAVQLSDELLGRRPEELSAGQRQRVGIARALALDPKCLVLDEPVSALDVSIQGQIVELLASLRRARALTLVMVSHDLHVIRALATKIAVLFAGRVIEVGPAAEVLASPKHPYSRALIEGRELSLDRSIAAEPGCAYRGRCPHRVDACADTPSLSSASHAAACFVMK